MSDVILIYPPVSYTAKFEDIKDDSILDHPPIGYLYIAAALVEKGFTVRVVDTAEIYSLKDTMKLINEESPKVVGISALTSNMRGAYQLAKEIKKRYGKKIVVALGGHHVSCDPDVVRRFPCFDFGVTGEGEITFTKLVDEIINHRKKGFKKVYIGDVPLDLDTLPFQARQLVDFKRYKGLWANNIVSSRGCPYHCIFCSRPAISRISRFRSPKLVVKEMRAAAKITGLKEFMFLDDTLNLNRKHVMKLCREMIKSGLNPTWNAQARLNLVDEEMIATMAKAGCKKLIFGVESGNDRVRNEIIKKGVSREQIKTGIRLCKKYGIEPDIYLMLGFPTETKEEMQDTIHFAERYNPNMIGVHITIPLPGSILWDDLTRKDKKLKNTIDRYISGSIGEGFRKNWPRYIPQGLTLGDLVLARNQANRSFYLRPQYVWHRIKNDITSWSAIKMDIIEAVSLLRFGRSHWGD